MITGDPDREGPIDRELGVYLQAFQRELAPELLSMFAKALR
ncbi:hypothetical protein [Aquisalimonas sp.]|nr:hypothetical protein [Aquisalimonas sp.]